VFVNTEEFSENYLAIYDGLLTLVVVVGWSYYSAWEGVYQYYI
jgi:hypothetical protein